MTYWTSEENYGQLLQGFAMQRFLKDKGHDPYLIRYDYKYDQSQTEDSGRNMIYSRGFDEFRSKYMNLSEKVYHGYKELISDPPEADMYITGSDQIWYLGANPEKKLNRLHAYFLDFGREDITRHAVAASWGGCRALSQRLVDEITPLIARLDSVSVRERSGIDFCRLCGREDAGVIDDPTTFLPSKIYKDLYKSEDVGYSYGHFVLLYYINQGNLFDPLPIYNRAKREGLEVVYVPVGKLDDNIEKSYPTVIEWLWLIDHAEYVITNSFHCMIFSILFHKQFYAIRLKGYSIGMNTRIDNLFENYDIPESRYLWL